MMNLLNLLVFAYLAISGVILTYVVLVTDKTRTRTKKQQPSIPAGMVIPGSIVFFLMLYTLRFGLMTGTGVFSGVGMSVLVGGFVAIVPIVLIGLLLIRRKRKRR